MKDIEIFEKLKSINCNEHYVNRYFKFIIACRDSQNLTDRYHKHHFLPKSKSMFPEFSSLLKNPWNQINLTYKQHLIAHLILARAYGSSMLFALNRMLTSIDSKGNKIYSKETAEKYCLAMSKISDWRKENFIDKGNPFYGKKHSYESILKMKESAKKRPPISDETRQKMSEHGKTSFKGKKHSIESKEKMRAKKIGPKNNRYGIKQTQETINKRKEAFNKINSKTIVCPYCGKEGKPSGMKVWHFNNCKRAR